MNQDQQCMSRRTKRKIVTDGAVDVFGTHPFEGLKCDGLPAGPSAVSVPRANTESQSRLRGRVEVRREKAGRAGKTVTTVRAFPSQVSLDDLEGLTAHLKRICACGGTLKGRSLELQGEVCDRVMDELNKLGYQVVRAGG